MRLNINLIMKLVIVIDIITCHVSPIGIIIKLITVNVNKNSPKKSAINILSIIGVFIFLKKNNNEDVLLKPISAANALKRYTCVN